LIQKFCNEKFERKQITIIGRTYIQKEFHLKNGDILKLYIKMQGGKKKA